MKTNSEKVKRLSQINCEIEDLEWRIIDLMEERNELRKELK